MGCRIGVAALVGTLVPAGVVRADHDMAMSENHQGEVSELSVGLAVEAAEFDTRTYVGSYQAVTPSVGWMRGRFGAGATLGLYHLTENGRSLYGAGDAMLTGHAAVFRGEAIEAGAAVHVMLPSGSELDNLGMGHTMAMAAAWATWHAPPLSLAASAGYARALIGDTGGHDHGAMPLVDPMNLREATWSAAAAVDVGHGVQLGGRARGGIAIGSGTSRVIGSGRVAWGTPRVSTGLEVQLGLVGDPFTIRGVLDTALRF